MNSVWIKLAESFRYCLSFELHLVSSLVQKVDTCEGRWQESVFDGSPIANAERTTCEQFDKQNTPVVIVCNLPFRLLFGLFGSLLGAKLILGNGKLHELGVVGYIVVLVEGVAQSPHVVKCGNDTHCTQRPVLVFRHVIDQGTALHFVPVPLDQKAHIR